MIGVGLAGVEGTMAYALCVMCPQDKRGGRTDGKGVAGRGTRTVKGEQEGLIDLWQEQLLLT